MREMHPQGKSVPWAGHENAHFPFIINSIWIIIASSVIKQLPCGCMFFLLVMSLNI